ncbi:PREDICTED: caspase recruitment domain-containing protein 8-like [Cyprinodon variegatus]|uniref:caspase recruitment domain-containing protein 8-like n=1 Tax=Cyprinodon variegatus TaxID=28743 RepID=UPI000742B651|nr:PREDICTED: caspase recruitment domain-containing protein 8-like [Cyprinodon variegatus]
MSNINEPQYYILHETVENFTLCEREKIPSCLSHSCPSLSQEPPADISNFPRSPSLPTMKLQGSFKEFTPDFTDDEGDGIYWFRCSSPGLYQCRESGLVFDMRGEGDVSYRIVPWDRRLLSQHGKKPAGPLFDISCQQQSVAQLHLPHCEIRSTGGCHFLSVAHMHDEGIDFIRPVKITETHVVINITGFSPFGNIKDEDSPPDLVQALVLLFHKHLDPESDHLINVLMLPKNIVLEKVLRFRKKLDENEVFLETPPHCKLQPKQLYTLSTCPGEELVLVQPTEGEFDPESYDNYFPTFQVVYKEMRSRIKLFLRDSSSSSVWERWVCFSTARVRRSYGPTRQNLSPKELLEEIRSSFIDRISESVLKKLQDKMLEKKVLNDSEREDVEAGRTKRDKARVLVDTVRNKGDAASSEMIRSLCVLDPYLSGDLKLM